MKQRTKAFVAFLGLGVLGMTAGLYRYLHHPVAPPLVTVPFAMDKSGATARVDFTIERNRLTKRRMMIALEFPKSPDFSIERALEQNAPAVRVAIFREDQGRWTTIPIEGYEELARAVPGAPVSDGSAHPLPGPRNIRLHLYGWNDTSSVLIGGFSPTEPGHYYATIETLEDVPMFSGVRTVLKVDDFYNTGK